VVALILVVFDVWLGDRYWRAPRYGVFDAYQRLFPRQAERYHVTIVDIDNASLARLGQWPWPRTRLAQLIETTAHLGALAVGLDIVMPEADRLSPGVLIADRPDWPQALREELARLPSNDAILADTLRRVPSIVGRVGLPAGESGASPSKGQAPVRVHGALSLASLQAYGAHIINVPLIDEAAFGRGYLNAMPEADGVVRAVPLLVVVDGELAPTLALEMLRVAAQAPFYRVYGSPDGVQGIQLGTSFIPTDLDGRIWLHYTLPDATDRRRRVSALAILNGEVEANALANHLAIIGVTGVGLTDVWATPVAALMDGVEVQAQTIENILDGSRLIRSRLAPWLEVTFFLSVATAQIAFVPRLRLAANIAVFLGAAGLLTTASLMSFVHARQLLDPSFPVAGNAAILAILLTAAYTVAERRRQQLQTELDAARLEQVRRDGELRAARAIQLGMVPAPGAIEGLPDNIVFHAILEPAEEVGGDLYDAFMLDDSHFFFLVGDVADKGIPASLFMALSKTLIKHTAVRERVPLATLMTWVNTAISRDNPANLFVTALAGIIDVRTGALELCSAGHEAPILLRAGAAPCVLDTSGGPALCVLEDFCYTAGGVQLQPDDTLVMITDGVTEAQNSAQHFYSLGRALAWLTDIHQYGSKWPSVESICQGLYADVTRFANGAIPADDITIMAIRYRGPLSASPSSPSG
jgi:serine phosphatase RsbU (regulator of sigma subunit)